MKKRILAGLMSLCVLSTGMTNASFASQISDIGGGQTAVVEESMDSSENLTNTTQDVQVNEDVKAVQVNEDVESEEKSADKVLEDEVSQEKEQENSIASEVQEEKQTDNDLLDSHEDDPVMGSLDKDDFETVQEWEEYIRENPSEYDTIMASPSPQSTVSAKAKLRYTVTGLPCATSIQKVYIKDKEVYVTQRYGRTTYLSRCEIDKTTKQAVCKDFMTLQRFGHGQTLEYFEWNGKAYFWIACKPNTAYDADWAMQIGRISYEPNTTIDYTQVCRFGTLNYANETGIGLDGVKRVDAALSDDGSKLLIWVRSPEGVMQYSWYDADALNQILDEKESEMAKYVSFLDNERLRGGMSWLYRANKFF